MPIRTFRYIACGGFNTVLGLVLYSIVFVHILHQKDVHITGDYKVTARVAALFIAFCINFPLGFTLSSYIVFPESQLHGKVQLFRYSLATATFLALSYLLTKVFAIILPFRADVNNIFVSIITAILSYISQRLFTFKIEKEEETREELIREIESGL
jgi:putative flippase GtrA